MRLAYILIAILLSFSAALAYTPLIYSKTTIKIVPAEGTALEKKPDDKKKPEDDKKAEDSKASELMPTLHRAEKEFTVEVRPLSFIEQKDFIAIQPFTDREGMIMVIDPPAQATLHSSNLLGKTDVLFVLEDGAVEKIAPNLDLAGLSEPITTDKPVRAFVFLKAGTAQNSDIRPGDHVVGFLFKSQPVILQ